MWVAYDSHKGYTFEYNFVNFSKFTHLSLTVGLTGNMKNGAFIANVSPWIFVFMMDNLRAYMGSSTETVAFQVYEILKTDHEFLQFFWLMK